MEKKVLAKKAIKGQAVLGLLFMLFFLSLLIFILYKVNLKDVKLSLYVIFVCLCLSGLSFWGGYFTVHNIRLPKVMLTYDDNGIYITYKNYEFIPFKDILNIYCNHITYRGKTFKHGYLDIITTNKKYKLGLIDNLKDVENIIKKYLI